MRRADAAFLALCWTGPPGRTMLQRSIMIAMLVLLATPAAAEWRIPCLSALFGSGCSVTFVSPEYAARPVQPLNPQAALADVNAFRGKNGRNPVVLDARLSQAAAVQSKDQAGRSSIGHYGSDGSQPMQRRARGFSREDRLRECRRRAEILQRRHAQLGGKFRPSGESAASRGDLDWCRNVQE
jgi:hypothetical protein